MLNTTHATTLRYEGRFVSLDRRHDRAQHIYDPSVLCRCHRCEATNDLYRLPNGTVIKTDATATKGQSVIDYEVEPVNGKRQFVSVTFVG